MQPGDRVLRTDHASDPRFLVGREQAELREPQHRIAPEQTLGHEVTALATGKRDPVSARELERNLTSTGAVPDHDHLPRRDVRGAAVAAEVDLSDRFREL